MTRDTPLALPVLGPDTPVGHAVAIMREAFARAGLDTPGLDARVLAGHALGLDGAALLTRAREPVGPDGAGRLAEAARRRLGREPVARILGKREFWGLPFRLSPETLVPRPDTETVVAAALDRVPGREAAPAILDLGTGSGCLLVALLVERPRAWGLGLDRSPGALRTARANAEANGVGPRAAFAASDWAGAVGGRFDLVVSNPPYIPGPAIAGLDPEVAGHDPRAALDGGPDGLDAVRAILRALPGLLRPGGVAVLEIGIGQGAELRRLGRAAGLSLTAVVPDLGGRDRAVVLAPPARP